MKATRVCTVEDCDRPWRVRRLCATHYEKARYAGVLPPKVTAADRLAEGSFLMPGGCIEWRGARNRNGYGLISKDGKATLAHRLAWVLANGPIPDGMVICHHCDNPPCVNTDHLFLGTVRDNSLDMAAKGRSGGQKRTHCPSGHPYDDMNTYRYPDGRRRCRSCTREQDRQRRARRAAA